MTTAVSSPETAVNNGRGTTCIPCGTAVGMTTSPRCASQGWDGCSPLMDQTTTAAIACTAGRRSPPRAGWSGAGRSAGPARTAERRGGKNRQRLDAELDQEQTALDQAKSLATRGSSTSKTPSHECGKAKPAMPKPSPASLGIGGTRTRRKPNLLLALTSYMHEGEGARPGGPIAS